NFGVVTSFEFQLHPMERQVLAGRILFPIARTRDVLDLFGELAPAAPDHLQLDCGMVAPPDEPGVVGFSICYSGPPGGADAALAPGSRLGGAVQGVIAPIDYTALHRSGVISAPRAQGMYTTLGFIHEVSPELISVL